MILLEMTPVTQRPDARFRNNFFKSTQISFRSKNKKLHRVTFQQAVPKLPARLNPPEDDDKLVSV